MSGIVHTFAFLSGYTSDLFDAARRPSRHALYASIDGGTTALEVEVSGIGGATYGACGRVLLGKRTQTEEMY